jgi:hypothetical protein
MAGVRARVAEHAERRIRPAEQAEADQDEGADQQEAAGHSGGLHEPSAVT